MSSRTAIVRFQPDVSVPIAKTITGQAVLKQDNPATPIHISLSVTGLAPSTTHGWHIHGQALEQGPINCTKAGTHFNPRNSTHGSPNNDATKRHVGDLGNFKTDANGSIKLRVTDRLVTLFGNETVNNLALVVHERVDDFGLGGANVSKTTGNTGLRLACGNVRLQSAVVSGYSTATESSDTANETGSVLSAAMNQGSLVFLLALLFI